MRIRRARIWTAARFRARQRATLERGNCIRQLQTALNVFLPSADHKENLPERHRRRPLCLGSLPEHRRLWEETNWPWQ